MNKVWVLLSLVFLVGCNTANMKVDYYQPKVVGNSNYATIIGSRIENGAFVADEVLYILAVDGMPVENAKEYGQKPFLLPSGEHTIQVAFAQGKLHAQIAFKSVLKTNEVYKIEAKKNALESVTFWISEQSTKKLITEKLVGKIVSDELSPMFIPIMVN